MANLEYASNIAAPFFGGTLDKSHPEEQLITAFYKARDAVFGDLPDGTQLDVRRALLANEAIGQQIYARQNVLASHMEAGVDVPTDSGISLNSEDSRQYYLGKYLAGAQGLGAYTSGLVRQSVDAGVLSQADYFDGIEKRIRAFSDIIYAGETDQLASLVNAEKFGGNQIVQTEGTLVEQSAVSGLSGPIPIPVLVGVVIVAITLVGGATYYAVQKSKIDRTVDMTMRVCQDATKAGNQEAIKACIDMGNEATKSRAGLQSLFGEKGQEQILNYALLGGAVYLGVLLLPSITQSILSTQQVVGARPR